MFLACLTEIRRLWVFFVACASPFLTMLFLGFQTVKVMEVSKSSKSVTSEVSYGLRIPCSCFCLGCLLPLFLCSLFRWVEKDIRCNWRDEKEGFFLCINPPHFFHDQVCFPVLLSTALGPLTISLTTQSTDRVRSGKPNGDPSYEAVRRRVRVRCFHYFCNRRQEVVNLKEAALSRLSVCLWGRREEQM
jgi:hypothetical protein